jgi:hypothetical protein
VHGHFGRELMQVKLQDIDASVVRARQVREAKGSLNHPRPKVSFGLGGSAVRIAFGVVRLIDAGSKRLPGSRAASRIRSKGSTTVSPSGYTGRSPSGST